jgi:DMSO/TMAO reductase YedYZ molybdopterin-dependent catalytic subunit
MEPERSALLDKYLRREDERSLLEKKMREQGRLPPGQSATIKWPVLHEGEIPGFDPKTWDFRVGGLVEAPVTFTWDEFAALPEAEVPSDFHCVTRWSTFDNVWQGVPFREVPYREQRFS